MTLRVNVTTVVPEKYAFDAGSLSTPSVEITSTLPFEYTGMGFRLPELRQRWYEGETGIFGLMPKKDAVMTYTPSFSFQLTSPLGKEVRVPYRLEAGNNLWLGTYGDKPVEVWVLPGNYFSIEVDWQGKVSFIVTGFVQIGPDDDFGIVSPFMVTSPAPKDKDYDTLIWFFSAQLAQRIETVQIEAHGIHHVLGLPLAMNGGSGQN